MTEIQTPLNRSAIDRVQKFGPAVALIILIVGTALFEHFYKHSHTFISTENIFNVLRQNSMVGVVALGMTFVIILGGIDLSVGAIVAFAGGLGVWILKTLFDAQSIVDMARSNAEFGIVSETPAQLWLAEHFIRWHLAGHTGLSLVAAFGVILLVGVLAGVLNGLLVTKGRLAPFIATLGTMAILRSLALTVANGGQYTVPPAMQAFQTLGAAGLPVPGLYVDTEHRTALELGYPVVVFAVLAVIMHVLLRCTRFGRYVVAIGCNERAVLYSGISVDRIKLLAYTLLGLVTGVAALLTASRMNSVSPSQTGNLMELDAIAAVAIGGTSMRGGSGTVLGTVIGVLILGVIKNMTGMLDVSSHLQGTVTGTIILAAVMIQRSRK